MSLSLKNALQFRNEGKLGQILKQEPGLANSSIRWGDDGKHVSSPLHFLSSLIFEEGLEQHYAISLAEVLIHYGADLDAINPNDDNSPLITAISLGAENYALWLVSTGADFQQKGQFGATALHWAAMMGQDQLVEALLHMKSDITIRDETNKGTPLDWAIYGWKEKNIPAKTNRQPICAAFLVGVGSPVTGDMLTQLNEEEDGIMLTVLEPESILKKNKTKKDKKTKDS